MSDGSNDSSSNNPEQRRDGLAMFDGSGNDSSSDTLAQRWHGALRQRLGGINRHKANDSGVLVFFQL